MGIRRDWYQSNETVILGLLIKGSSEVNVTFDKAEVLVTGKDKGLSPVATFFNSVDWFFLP